ncbi:MAG: SdrD B-like domain-containing protein, partial [Cyanobacteria bacterium J06641_2]
MKALFKHLSAITQGEPGSVANNTSPSSNNISTPFLSTTLLAVLLGVPQVPLIGVGKVAAQTGATSCPAGTVPETVQFQASDSLRDLTEQYNIGGINTVLNLSEEFPGQVIDRTESRFDPDVYGGLPGPNLRLNIGPGKPNRADQAGGTGNLAPGNAILTINFAQPVTLASPLTLLDVDRNGERDRGRIFQDRVTVTASDGNSNVPVSLQALGDFTQVSGNTAFGIQENSLPTQGEGNVSITPSAAVDQIRIVYTPSTDLGPRGQDQTIGLAPFTICAVNPAVTGSIGDTVYRDNNNNNVQDEGDVGIPNVPVTLTLPGPDGQLNTQDDTTQNTTTNEQGIYTFPNLPAGNYQVTVATPDGLTPTQTQPNPVDLQAGQNRDDVDFGFAPPQVGSIGDTVYRDNNNNNVQDEGDVGIPNVPVT